MPGFFLCRLFAMTKVRHSTTQTPGYSLSSMDQSLPPRKDRTFAMVKPHQIETVSGFGLIQLSLIWGSVARATAVVPAPVSHMGPPKCLNTRHPRTRNTIKFSKLVQENCLV